MERSARDLPVSSADLSIVHTAQRLNHEMKHDCAMAIYETPTVF